MGDKPAPRRQPVATEAISHAQAYEADIAQEAEALRGDAAGLSEVLLNDLLPLLCKPIHEGHLVTISSGEGKPYPSTGIRSVQLQINRMDAVLRPWWWHETITYHQEGRVCEVTVAILDSMNDEIFSRSAWGGIDRGNTKGNLYKGSYTNAAKLAFARIGIGAEVYAGLADFDPDVSEAAREEQTKRDTNTGTTLISADRAGELRSKIAAKLDEFEASDEKGRKEWGNDLKRMLGAMGITGTKAINTNLLMTLTPEQAAQLDQWLLQGGTE